MQLINVNLVLTLLLTNLVSSQNGGGVCQSIQVRKEIRDMTVTERKTFINAIKSINAKGASRPTVYDSMVQIHVDNNAQIHSDPVFLAWHRHYIHYFQSLIRKNYPEVVVPYWDWARDSQAPERSEIFSAEFFGSTGLPSTNYCIKDGPFRQGEFDVLTSDRGQNLHCLARNFDKGEKLSAFSNPSSIERLKTNNQNYDDFAGRLELMPHALPHNYIGHNYGDMSTMSSPNDPIFWLHHGMVDKIWADWQILKGKQVGQAYHSQRSTSDTLPYFGDVKVSDVLDTTQYPYCYVYAGQPIPEINKPQPSANSTTSSAVVVPTPSSSIEAVPSSSSSQAVLPPSSSVGTPSFSAPSSVVQVLPTSSIPSSSTSTPTSTSTLPPTPAQSLTPPSESNNPSNPGPGRPGRPSRPGGGFFISPEMLRQILESLGIRLNRRSYKTEDDLDDGHNYPTNNKPAYPSNDQKYPDTKPKYPTKPDEVKKPVGYPTKPPANKPKYPVKPPSIIHIIHDGMSLAMDVASLLTPKAVLKELNKLCPPNKCPASDDRTDLYKLRVPEPIKEEWIRMNRLSVEKFRIQELENAQYTYELNSNNGFVSEAALSKRWGSSDKKEEEIEVIKKEKVYKKVNVRQVVHY